MTTYLAFQKQHIWRYKKYVGHRRNESHDKYSADVIAAETMKMYVPVYSGKHTVSADFFIFSSNKSFLFRNRIIDVSVNHLLLQMESNSFRLSCMRFCNKGEHYCVTPRLVSVMKSFRLSCMRFCNGQQHYSNEQTHYYVTPGLVSVIKSFGLSCMRFCNKGEHYSVTSRLVSVMESFRLFFIRLCNENNVTVLHHDYYQ